MIRTLALVLVLVALGLSACEPELDDAFADVREAAPGICNDYCSAQRECEEDRYDGPEGPAAADADEDQCLVNCSWLAAEGTFVRNEAENAFVSHVSGKALEDWLSCLWSLGLFECNDDSFGIDYDAIDSEEECVSLDACYAPLEIDQTYDWMPLGNDNGYCMATGSESIDALF